MQTDDPDNTRLDPIPPDWIWVPTPAAPTPDRAAYEAARRAELDDVRLSICTTANSSTISAL